MGNLMPANDGRYPLWTAIFGILITAIPLAIRIVTTGFDGDTSKIGIGMYTSFEPDYPLHHGILKKPILFSPTN